MRFATIENNIVIYVLPAELMDDYKELPPMSVEIEKDADVLEGDVYEKGEFRRRTKEEWFAYYKLIRFDPIRVTLFASTQWVRERHSDRVAQGNNDEESWKEWQEYWQVLRDAPMQEGFDPQTYVFPKQPK